MRTGWLIVAALLALGPGTEAGCLAAGSEAGAGAGKKLVRMVVLSRHGVRAPIYARNKQNTLAARPWRAWPVGPGVLTPRGARLAQAQWKNLRPHFRALGVLPATGCPEPGSVQAWADTDKDGRTAATAQALLDGLAPECGLRVRSDPALNPVFHPLGAGVASLDEALVSRELEEGRKTLDIAQPLALLHDITGDMAPSWCGRGSGPCSVTEVPEVRPFLFLAYEIIEDLLLEYAEWPETNAGWGRVDAAALERLLPALNKSFALRYGTPAVAVPSNSALTAAIRDALLDERAPRFLAYVGHDSNIAGVATLLHLDWTVPDQGRGGMPPACFLAFGLWEDRDGRQEVDVRFFAAPLATLHSARPEEAGPLFETDVPLPACGPDCTPQAFSRLVDGRVRPDALVPYASFARQ